MIAAGILLGSGVVAASAHDDPQLAIAKEQAELERKRIELEKKSIELRQMELDLEKQRQELQAQQSGQSLNMNLSGDLLFDYDIMVREKSTDTLSGYFDYRARGGGGDMGDAFMGYEEGTLVIVAYDPRTRQMVWRGSATAMLTKERIKDAVVDDAIHRMFQRFA